MSLPQIYLEAINSGLDYCILIGKNPIYQYENGKKVSDIPLGWRLNVLLPGNSFSSLSVKLNTPELPLPSIDNEDIADACTSMNPILIKLTDCMVSIYAMDGLKMSAVASAVEVIKPSKQ